MKNREKYFFDDFTLNNYSRLLDIAIANGFVFGDYNCGIDTSCNKEIVWRHDVEFSVHQALKMAKIEESKGIKSHYFFQTHSEYYNILSKEIKVLASEIVGMKHFVGLHFDAHFWEIRNEAHFIECLLKDKLLLEELLGVRIKSFSFHNTSPALLAMDQNLYAGMLNVYAHSIRTRYRYCSDSTGIWRFERLEDVLNDDNIKFLHVLTHDGMWQDTAMAPRQRFVKCIEAMAKRRIDYYDENLPKKGQLNIDE